MSRFFLTGLVLLVGASLASADTITFGPLSGPNSTVYTGHTEGDFTTSPTGGDWRHGFNVGNPIPSVFSFQFPASLAVEENSSGLFTFQSIDLGTGANSPGTYDYKLTGKRGGSTEYTVMGMFSGSVFTGFQTVSNPFSSASIDLLEIDISNPQITSVNVDNIVVNGTVPEPASLALLGVAIGVIGLTRRRRRKQA